MGGVVKAPTGEFDNVDTFMSELGSSERILNLTTFNVGDDSNFSQPLSNYKYLAMIVCDSYNNVGIFTQCVSVEKVLYGQVRLIDFNGNYVQYSIYNTYLKMRGWQGGYKWLRVYGIK